MEAKNKPATPVKPNGDVLPTGRRDPGETPEECRQGETDEVEWLERIAGSIARLEYPPVPPDFLASVMKNVQSRKMPWWYRWYRWAKSPHTLRVTPLRLAPGVMLLLLALYVGFVADPARRGAQPALPGSTGEAGVVVTFELKMPEAGSVHLVGSFNGWAPGKCEMKRSDGATWTVRLQLPAGRYEYAFLVDGKTFVVDPGGELYQDDGFGNRNNILVVGNNHETAI